MMIHTFNYLEYEFRDTPAAQALPDLKANQAYLEEAEWKLAELHPIRGALRSLETVYMRYSFDKGPMGPLHHLLLVAYSAHPLFGAHATLRIVGIIRLTHGAEEEFNAMTLAADTFARYASLSAKPPIAPIARPTAPDWQASPPASYKPGVAVRPSCVCISSRGRDASATRPYLSLEPTRAHALAHGTLPTGLTRLRPTRASRYA